MPGLIVPAIAGALGAASGTLGYALIELAVGLAFTAAVQEVLADDSSQSQDQRRDLRFPADLPVYRFPYGQTRVTATILPHPVVGEYGYGVYLLSSRPGDGTPTLYLDGREITLTGDPYDFTGAGATPSSGDLVGHLQVWVGLGGQSGPPDEYLAGAPYHSTDQPLGFKATDAGAGLTVLYLKYRAGDSGSVSQRWPNVPPNPEVEGLRTPVWDMRDVAQDPDDPSTWAGTSNHALNTLDVLRNNPFRPHDDKYMILDMWEDAANEADISIPLASGGAEPKWTVDGTVVFDGSELEQIMAPLFEAGAARRVNIGGQIGIAPGRYETPTYTITSILEGIEFANMKPGSEMLTKMKTIYVSAARGYADAELQLWDIPGVGASEEPKTVTQRLPFTTSPYRAMRLRKIRALRARQQREMSGILPPGAMDLVVASTATCALGGPYATRVDGAYEVETIHPAAYSPGNGAEDGPMQLSIPAKLRGTAASIYTWDTSEEEAVYSPSYTVAVNGVQVPGTITATVGSGVNLDSGGTIIPRARFDFDPSPSAGVIRYEWQARVATTGTWGEVEGTVSPEVLDGDGDVFAVVEWLTGGALDFRARAVVSDTEKSEWVEITGVTPTVSYDLGVPVIGALSEAPAGTVSVPAMLPNKSAVRGAEFAVGPDSDVNNAASLGISYGTANQPVAFEESGLGSGVTLYYFARCIGPSPSVGTWTAGKSITTA